MRTLNVSQSAQWKRSQNQKTMRIPTAERRPLMPIAARARGPTGKSESGVRVNTAVLMLNEFRMVSKT